MGHKGHVRGRNRDCTEVLARVYIRRRDTRKQLQYERGGRVGSMGAGEPDRRLQQSHKTPESLNPLQKIVDTIDGSQAKEMRPDMATVQAEESQQVYREGSQYNLESQTEVLGGLSPWSGGGPGHSDSKDRHQQQHRRTAYGRYQEMLDGPPAYEVVDVLYNTGTDGHGGQPSNHPRGQEEDGK